MKEIILIILSLMGFADSFYLYYTKTRNKPLYCLSKDECDAVIKSKYGKTFGIENTLMGALYFALVLIYAILLLFNRNLFKQDIVYYSLVGISIASVGFSAYLTAVQAFVLKKWCEYCIISSVISVLILVVII